MTNQEEIQNAIEWIEGLRNGWNDEDNIKYCNMAIKTLEQTRWIPVSERLPEVDVDVLVTDNGGGLPTVIIDACGIKDDTGERFWYISQTPVAWRKWLEPYKAESEDKE